MKRIILLLSILISSFAAYGQVKEPYAFPGADSEFTVTFPGKPIIEAVVGAGGISVAAELKLSSGFLKAEILKLPPKEAKAFSKKDDKALADYPLKYAEASGIADSKIETGADEFGRYAKLRGSKKVNDIPTTFEIYFYVGKSAVITLYAASESAKYPAAEITGFFDSLRLGVNSATEQTGGKNSDSAGNLNGRALFLARPEYPPAARAVRASGAIYVQVKINEDGNVVSAKAISGHPLLQQAAEKAALQSRFSPFIFYGQALKVTGIVVYNFEN